MIVRAFGIPTMTRAQVCTALDKLNVDYGVVQAGQLERFRLKGREKTPCVPIVFDTASSFLARQNKFKVRVLALVIGDPITLNLSLGLPCLGVRVDKSFKVEQVPFNLAVLREVVRRTADAEDHILVTREPLDIPTQLLGNYSTSVLPTLQAVLYKIKDKTAREQVSRAVRLFLASPSTLNKLEPQLYKFMGTSAESSRTTMRLMEILRTDEFKVFRTAVRTARTTGRIDAVAKKHRISPFDIRYTLAGIRPQSQPQPRSQSESKTNKARSS